MHIVTTTNNLIIFLVIAIFIFVFCHEKTKALILNILIIVGGVIALININENRPAPTTQPTTQQVFSGFAK